MKNNFKRVISLLLVLLLVVGLVPTTASASVKINKTKATIEVDSKLKLKISGTKSKITWKTSKKSVATVSSAGNVTAKKEGQATITATVGGKNYKCVITVTSKKDDAKKLEDLIKYLKKNDVISGTETKMDATMIGGIQGVKYSDSRVEIYEFDVTTDTYKNMVKTNKLLLSDFNIELTVDGINGKFIIFYTGLENKDDIISIFNDFK